MTRYPTTPPDDGAWKWLDTPRSTPELHLVGGDPDIDEHHESPSRDDRWLVALPETPDTADTSASSSWWNKAGRRLPPGAGVALAAVVAVLVGIVAASGADSDGADEDVATTARPPSAVSVVEDACTGLSGTVVTDRAGDPTTVPGVVASFQAAYYLSRDAAVAMRLLAPESGITLEGLAAGIASIPPGTTHCVAITPISATTANVHIAELRAVGQRIDYLQVVNTRPGPAGALLISNIQRQG